MGTAVHAGGAAEPLALAAGNCGAALTGLLLPGRVDDAMRVAVVRRYYFLALFACRFSFRVF
jgi:hypothetical protein